MIRISVRPFLVAASLAVSATLAHAQSTAVCLPIGSGGAVGCQSEIEPTLTNGVVATGDIEFDYDAATGILTVTVDNSSPIVSGETNPVITQIGFNVPAGTVNSASLLAQTGSGGTAPAFSLDFGGAPRMGCLGYFSAVLAIQGIQGGIGNSAASIFPNSNVVLGPVEFEIQLAGPGVGGLTSNAIATELSQEGNPGVASAVKFQGGGVNGEESGWVSSGGTCCLNQASVVSVGSGCAPSGATIPTLSSIGLPVPGGPIGVDISSPSTPNSFGLVVYGFSSTFDPVFNMALPLGLGPFGFPGCSLNASSEFSIPVMVDGSGSGSHSFGVPALAKWCEREITFQAVFLSASNDLLASAGLTAIIGN